MNRIHSNSAATATGGKPWSRLNPVVVLTILLPLFAVAASVGTAVIAFSRGDAALPDEYHWEGDKLDHDFAQSERAAALNVSALADLQPIDGKCRITLEMQGSPPRGLDVRLIHVTRPALDRRIRFLRSEDAASYLADCTPIPAASWHVELSDIDGTWSFREDASGSLQELRLSAVTHATDSAWR